GGSEVTMKLCVHDRCESAFTVMRILKICPKMAEMTIENMFGDILQRTDILDIKTRELIIISSLVTLGGCENQIKAHTEAAIVTGATKEEISEAILQTAYFAGFPKAANALISIKELF
ncbi:carboxymuconolactone decarboxylase family protein, partial [Francisellaceae bacterium CB300]